jgi:hypothetical protein
VVSIKKLVIPIKPKIERWGDEEMRRHGDRENKEF